MKSFFCILFCLTASSLLASDDVASSDPTPTLATPPAALVTVMPSVSRSQVASNAEVRLLVIINQYGYVTGAMVKHSTNPALDDPCLDAIRQWRFKPAEHNGTPVTASFIQPFTFGQDTFDSATGITARPKTRRQVPPLVPEALKHISGLVTIAVRLDNQGKISGTEVISSSHEELNAVTLSAVQQWEFSPAYINGKAVPSTVYAPFEFIGEPLPKANAVKPVLVDNSELKPLRQSSPRVPAALATLNGEAEIEFVIDHKGYVAEAKTISSTQPALGELARQAVLNWKFTPLVKNGVAVPVKAVQPFRFGQGNVVLAQIDRLPEVVNSVNPEVPAALEGTSGFANIIFDLNAKGQITAVEVKECSHEKFRAAVLVAAGQWKFKPALRAGEPVSARVTVPFVFGKK